MASCHRQQPGSWDIAGDWVNSESRFFISFTDTTVGQWGWGDFSPYRVAGDFIISKKEDTIRRAGDAQIRRIVVNDWDTLMRFQGIGDTLRITFSEDKFNFGTQQVLYRLLPKNNMMFDSIFFASTMCYGYCPAMNLMIHSDGRMYFNGEEYAEKQGYYSTTLPENMMALIVNKFRQVDFNNIDSAYTANYTDSQGRYLVTYINGIRRKYEVYGFEEEPLELDILFHYLMELYKWVELKETQPFKLRDVEIIFAPPPVPPIPAKISDILDNIQAEIGKEEIKITN